MVNKEQDCLKNNGTNDVDNVLVNCCDFARLRAHLKYLSHNSQS